MIGRGGLMLTNTVMQNYEAKKPSYFATPSPQLVHALHTALSQILSKPISERFAAHKAGSDRIKKAVTGLGLKQVAGNPAEQAHGMTAIYLPEGVKGTDLLPILGKKGVVFAGGIHKEIATKYIRFGHMGVSLVSYVPLWPNSGKEYVLTNRQLDPKRTDVDHALKSLEEGLAECGYKKP